MIKSNIFYNSGDYIPKKGIIFKIDGNHLTAVSQKNAPQRLNYTEAEKYCKNHGCRLPTPEEASLLASGRKSLNELFVRNGGHIFNDEWCWTSGQKTESYAEIYNFGQNIYHDTFKSEEHSFRPVMDIWLCPINFADKKDADLSEHCINAFNQLVSKAYADFLNALDEVEKITPESDLYLFKEKTAQIDKLYQSIVTAYRPHLRRYVKGE